MANPYGAPPAPKKWWVGFEIGLLIMIGLIGLAAKQIYDYSIFAQNQIAYEQIVSDSQRLEVSLRQAHDAYIQYMKNGGEKFVRSYNQSLSEYGRNYQKIRDSLSNTPGHRLSLNYLVSASNLLFDRMNGQFKLKMSGRGAQAFEKFQSGEEAEVTAQAFEAFQRFQQEIDHLPSSQFEELKARAKWILITLIVGTLLALVMLVWSRNNSKREAQTFKTLSQVLAAGQEELLETNKRVKALSQAKSDFLANMSHEVRTPLNAITGLSHILLRTVKGKEEVDLIHGIQKSAQALLDVINPILDYSKIEHEGLELFQDASVDLGRLVSEAIEIMSGQAKIKGIELKADIRGDLKYVETDKIRLKQVMLNLIGNAVKFTNQGSVTLRVIPQADPRSSDFRCRFEVIDTGVGIPDEAKAKLFQSFTQSDSSISRQYGGTGLGLSISKIIVNKMRGQIGFESQLGVGTTFWFEIPFAIAQSAPAEEASVADQMGAVQKAYGHVRCLMVEDNPMNQFVLKSLLEEFDCHPEIVSSAQEALRRVEAEAFDLIFLDVQMPGMDGFTATEYIRKIEFEKRRKSYIVATTAHAMSGYRDKCLSAGMDDYLPKPVTVPNLQKIFVSQFEAKVIVPGVSAVPDPLLEKVTSIPAQGASREALVNQKRWEKLGTPKFRREMIALYHESTPPRFDEIPAALARGDYKAIEEAAHFLKSSTGALGFDRLTEILNQMESLASAGKPSPEFDRLHQELESERALVAQFLKKTA